MTGEYIFWVGMFIGAMAGNIVGTLWLTPWVLRWKKRHDIRVQRAVAKQRAYDEWQAQNWKYNEDD